MEIRMRMLPTHRRRLIELIGNSPIEQACFLITGSSVGDDAVTLFVREIVELSPRDYRAQADDLLSVSPEAMLRVVRRAQVLGGGICMVHTHPMANGEVNFSPADDYGNQQSFGFFNRMIPNSLHSCLVWDRSLECVAGRYYESATCWHPLVCVDVVGGERAVRLRDQLSRRLHASPAQFDRQARLLGDEGLAITRNLRIAVVGSGGVGSLVAQLLGHSGVGEIVLIDPDYVQSHNLPGIVGSTPTDADQASKKVDVVRRYLKITRPDGLVDTHWEEVQAASLRALLVGVDAIACCTDSTTSRAYLNEHCQRYLIPLLDLGVEFDADPVTGRIRGNVGKVNLMSPGSPCLSCGGDLPPDRLRWESLPPEQRDSEVRSGYCRNYDVPQPSMMMFNAEVAARGIQRLLGYFTGLIVHDSVHYERFDLLKTAVGPHVRVAIKRAQDHCTVCSVDRGIVGHGDNDSMHAVPLANINHAKRGQSWKS